MPIKSRFAYCRMRGSRIFSQGGGGYLQTRGGPTNITIAKKKIFWKIEGGTEPPIPPLDPPMCRDMAPGTVGLIGNRVFCDGITRSSMKFAPFTINNKQIKFVLPSKGPS